MLIELVSNCFLVRYVCLLVSLGETSDINAYRHRYLIASKFGMFVG